MSARRNKYGVAPKEARTADGIVFHSKHEMQDYLKLKMLLNAGAIKDLRLQVPFDLLVWTNGGRVKVGVYKADFVVTEIDGSEKVYDSKGVSTEAYSLKKKIVEACHGITINEI